MRLEGSSSRLPFILHMRDFSIHLFTRLPSLETSQEQFIVVCCMVANMGGDCKTNCFFIQLFGRCASPARAVFPTGMLCDQFFSSNILPIISFNNFPATIPVMPCGSRSGLYSTISAPTNSPFKF